MYNVFSLYVLITKDENQAFICKRITDDIYKEVLTGEKIVKDENIRVEKLYKFYSILGLCNYTTLKPLMLSKRDILSKYISINENLKIEEEETTLEDLIARVVDASDFYEQIADELTPSERLNITKLLPKRIRSCNTCLNMSCKVESFEKPIADCADWKNHRIIGEYKVLKMNRRY